MKSKTPQSLLCLPIAMLCACGGAPPGDDPAGGVGGGSGGGVGGTSSAHGGSGAGGEGGATPGGSGGASGPSVTAPEIFAALAAVYEADLSGGTAIVCGSLLPIFGGTESVAGTTCGYAGLHRVEVTEAGLVRFLDTTEPLEFVWDNRARELPPSSTRLNGGVEYYGADRNLTMMYPSADDLSFNILVLRLHPTATQEQGELTAPLARME